MRAERHNFVFFVSSREGLGDRGDARVAAMKLIRERMRWNKIEKKIAALNTIRIWRAWLVRTRPVCGCDFFSFSLCSHQNEENKFQWKISVVHAIRDRLITTHTTDRPTDWLPRSRCKYFFYRNSLTDHWSLITFSREILSMNRVKSYSITQFRISQTQTHGTQHSHRITGPLSAFRVRCWRKVFTCRIFN